MSVITYSAMLQGLQPTLIEIEIDTSPGMPAFVLIGLPGQAVGEAKERITTALHNCGIKPKAKRTIVNLAPADLRKTSSAFELAIAIGLLQLYEVLPAFTRRTILFGELSLTGEIKAIKGALPLVIAAKQLGFEEVFVPETNKAEVQIVDGIRIRAVSHLKDFIGRTKGDEIGELIQNRVSEVFVDTPAENQQTTFDEIIGQESAKQALEIAAAGGHNVYLVGPPGTGKSMLAESFTAFLPDLNQNEAIEVYSLHSIAGKLQHSAISKARPFRKIHHTISQAGLVGGGAQLSPGEISLAHRGVLFMDEFPEFPRYVLESLRQPLESKTITISRAAGTVQYPANFMLIAAANPCPCGYKGSEKKACVCSEYHQEQYKNKVSGPLLDRMDLKVWVGEVSIRQLGQNLEKSAEFSQAVNCTNSAGNSLIDRKARIQRARAVQKERFKDYPHLSTNADMSIQDIKRFCKLEPTAKHLLISTAEKLQLSARQYFRIIKVAQTVADLTGEEKIKREQVQDVIDRFIQYQ